jgi:hypothetical protein
MLISGGCRSCDRMVVGFTTTYAISANHHYSCEFESRSGDVYSILSVLLVEETRVPGENHRPTTSHGQI